MKRIIGAVTIIFAVSVISLFLKYSFTEDYRYKVHPNFDSNLNLTDYEVEGEETTEMYDLEDSEVIFLRFAGLGLSCFSIVYVIFTFWKRNKTLAPLDALNQENEILKKQIENNELKQRLKDISLNPVVENQASSTQRNQQIGLLPIEKPPDAKAEKEPQTIECSKCKALIEHTYTFCPKCGNSLRDESIASTKINTPVIATAISTEKYSSGLISTFVWSATLSLLTILFYVLIRGSIDSPKAVATLVQGVVARPLGVIFFAFIISLFFTPRENQIRKFNSVSTYAMGALTIGELGRWIAIGNS